MLGFGAEEPDINLFQKIKYFLIAHWRGVLIFFLPLALLGMVVPFPAKSHTWCAYTMVLMTVFWFTECLPLAVTGFIPIVIFPITGVMTSSDTCNCYMNDSVMLFLGSLMLGAAMEQCGLTQRLAYCAVRALGYSHQKLLLAICMMTMFVSMWITNTAATTMMVPVTFALLNVFEKQGISKLHEKDDKGAMVATDITTCYFCAAAYSATIGGIGTVIGTGTNLVFRGQFQTEYPTAPEYLAFSSFSAFAVPYMIVMNGFNYLCLSVVFFGFLRPKSPQAKSSIMPIKASQAAKLAIDENWKKLGKISAWEIMVLILFIICMVAFFLRATTLFTGWEAQLVTLFAMTDKKNTGDSAVAALMLFLMFLLPATCSFVKKNLKAKHHEDLPKGRAGSMLRWNAVNITMPFSFIFLLGGGFALSAAAKSTGLNTVIGAHLTGLTTVPNYALLFILILIVMIITNFASNVAVANILCPIAMIMAKELKQNPLWYNLAAGYSASYCFMVPLGTPPNLIVQGAAKIPTKKMIRAGVGTTITTLIITWIFISFYAPVIWPDLKTMPAWTGTASASAGATAPAPAPAPAPPGKKP